MGGAIDEALEEAQTLSLSSGVTKTLRDLSNACPTPPKCTSRRKICERAYDNENVDLHHLSLDNIELDLSFNEFDVVNKSAIKSMSVQLLKQMMNSMVMCGIMIELVKLVSAPTSKSANCATVIYQVHREEITGVSLK